MIYDAAIIGAGPAGHECALEIMRLGGKAILFEKGEVGGVCTNRGCIPTKAVAASCDVVDAVKAGASFGVEAEFVGIDADVLFKRRDRVAATLRKGVEKLLADAGVEVVRGQASIRDKNTIEVQGKSYEAQNIVIATGSVPTGAGGLALDGEYVISGDDAAVSRKVPERVAVIGAGFIGCEYAAVYASLGADVTLIEAQPAILSGEDPEIRQALTELLAKRMRIATGARVTSIDSGKKEVAFDGETIGADLVLLAVGRKPVYPEGLTGLGIAADARGLEVDGHMRTALPTVYAIGDVTQNLKLAHTAYAAGRTAAANIMGRDEIVDYSVVPWCVFTQPEVGRVGKTEGEAGEDVLIGRASYLANGKARCLGQRYGFAKVVVDAKTHKLLGTHILGAHASDLIGEACLAIKKGMSAEDVIATIHPHPTLTEIFSAACEDALA